MADDDIDYKAEYEKIKAERDSFESSLNSYIDENNKLKADLKVQQAINRRTIGANDEPPKDDKPTTKRLKDAYAELYAKKKE